MSFLRLKGQETTLNSKIKRQLERQSVVSYALWPTLPTQSTQPVERSFRSLRTRLRWPHRLRDELRAQ